MSYQAFLSVTAQRTISELPLLVQSKLYEEIRRFCESPASLSRPSAPPAEIPGRQVFRSHIRVNDHDYLVVVYFKYGADEKSLHILDVGYVRYEGSPF